MTLFFVAFDTGLQPLLVDANDEAQATELASSAGEGATPVRVVPIPPGVFVAGLFTEPEDDDDEEIVVDPLPHVIEYLERLDAIDAEPTELEPEKCGSEADGDEDEVITCELDPEHDGEHEGTTRDGSVVRWA